MRETMTFIEAEQISWLQNITKQKNKFYWSKNGKILNKMKIIFKKIQLCT